MGRRVTAPAVVRRARPTDAPALAAMLRARNSEPGLHPERLAPETVRRHLVEDARSVALVAEAGGRLLGLATAHPTFDTATRSWGLFLSDLWVEPPARRRGVARALLAALAREPGCGFVWWNADAGDDLALAFHRATGAREAATVDFTWEAGA